MKLLTLLGRKSQPQVKIDMKCKKVADKESTLIPGKFKETIHSLNNSHHIQHIFTSFPKIRLPNLRWLYSLSK